MVRIGFFLFCCVFSFTTLFGQKKAEGLDLAARGRWPEALAALRAYQAQQPGDLAVLARIGAAYYWLQQPDSAHMFLGYVLQKNPRDGESQYLLARTLHGQAQYEDAIEAYKQFLRISSESHPKRAEVLMHLRHCVAGMQVKASEEVALVENLGQGVNTIGDEFGAVPSINNPNRLYFSAAQESSTGGRRDANGYADERNGQICTDMYYATSAKGTWGEVRSLSSLLNTARCEKLLDFNTTGRILYFTRGLSLAQGDLLVDTANLKDEYAVNSPRFQGINYTAGVEPYLFFYNDSTLLFADIRPEGKGGYDLYLALHRKGAWMPPMHLGAPINTPYDEIAPFLAKDGQTIYYSTNNPTLSIGGFDVVMSTYQALSQAWQTPINIGTPLNSPADDTDFRLTRDAEIAFFTSDRMGGHGGRDLYAAYFKSPVAAHIVPQPSLFLSVAPPAQLGDTLRLAPLFYEAETDLAQGDNTLQLDNFAAKARQYSDLNIVINAFTDETGPAKFDLYYGIKRAELVAKALQTRGVPSERMVLRSVGAGFPWVRSVVGATPNPLAAKLNRRVELHFAQPTAASLPLTVVAQRPVLLPEMAATGWETWDKAQRGLTYRVLVNTTRQLWNSDVPAQADAVSIESAAGSGLYQYSVGTFDRFEQAVRQRQALKEQGLTEAAVVAMIDGWPVTKAAAIGLVRRFPDLMHFIKNTP